MDSIASYHNHIAQLQKLGEHWHRKLWYGSGPWDGDKFLNLYHHPLTDDIELRYEVPDQAPQLVFKIALADFDIDKLCQRLAHADNRKVSVQDKIAEVDRANEARKVEHEKSLADQRDEATAKVLWAMRKDTGHHVAPLTVPSLEKIR